MLDGNLLGYMGDKCRIGARRARGARGARRARRARGAREARGARGAWRETEPEEPTLFYSFINIPPKKVFVVEGPIGNQ